VLEADGSVGTAWTEVVGDDVQARAWPVKRFRYSSTVEQRQHPEPEDEADDAEHRAGAEQESAFKVARTDMTVGCASIGGCNRHWLSC